ncbi:MAG: hypothetical protein LC620_01700 [Halobacteriales archaeon]|nr:hypothetical protein [Halobacteriales archaeon]
MEKNSPYAAVTPNLDLWTVQQAVLQWTHEAADLCIELFLGTKRVLETQAEQIGPVVAALHPLAVSCTYTSESVLLLTSSVKPWDGDALLRSVIEGTAKFLHLAHGSPEERAAKLREFDIDLPEINRIKRHKRAADFLAAIPNPNDDEWRPLREVLLPPSELAELGEKYPRKARQTLESRWSFGGIVTEMERIPDHPFKGMRHLLHNYGLSSHIIHQDSDGVSIVTDRIARSTERREAVTLAHCGRVVSDVVSMTLLRATAAVALAGTETAWLIPLLKRREALAASIQPAHGQFHDIEFGSQTRAASPPG